MRPLGLELELEVFSSIQNQVSEKEVSKIKMLQNSVRSRDTESGVPQNQRKVLSNFPGNR